MKRLILAALAVVLAQGCTSSGYHLAGGDRAAGTVTLQCGFAPAYNCGQVTDEEELEAAEACRRWGYQDARKFGGGRVIKVGLGMSGFLQFDYQCVGDLE